jgi:hypothetical protein
MPEPLPVYKPEHAGILDYRRHLAGVPPKSQDLFSLAVGTILHVVTRYITGVTENSRLYREGYQPMLFLGENMKQGTEKEKGHERNMKKNERET